MGGVERTKEDVRDARGTRWVEDFFADTLALRTMRRAPGFTAALVLMLAIGMMVGVPLALGATRISPLAALRSE